MFTRPRVLSPVNGASPKRAPFTDLNSLPGQEDAKASKGGLDNFDWNRKLNFKNSDEKLRPKKKYVIKVAEEKENSENYSPNSRKAFSAFGKKATTSQRHSIKKEIRDRKEDKDDLSFDVSFEETSPRYESKDIQHENLLRIAHSMSRESLVADASPKSTCSSIVRGPPTLLISPPSLKSDGIIGSPLLKNFSRREVEVSPQTPDLSVSPSQQKTPPYLADYSDSKQSKEDESVGKQLEYSEGYEYYDENYAYNEEGYTEHQEYDSYGYSTADGQHFQTATEDHYVDNYYAEKTPLKALTPVKQRCSVVVVTEEDDISHEKSVVDSPDSTSSSLTNMSSKLEIEHIFSKVRHNRFEDVQNFLNLGTNLKIKDSNGNSLLHICAQNNLKKMANLILDNGGDINAENKKGMTPLDYCDNYHFQKLGDWFVQNGGDNGHILNQPSGIAQ